MVTTVYLQHPLKGTVFSSAIDTKTSILHVQGLAQVKKNTSKSKPISIKPFSIRILGLKPGSK